ncbi:MULTISPECIES: hypothetical protein [Sulfitobacter]|jgi:dihydrolipoamide dehydrogenase|uniref:Uncharacterized protein n=1 Tax=Sulfitobacter profundi TaxID=2679961 RepID=A0ABW1Z1M3_9RHOB|nr:hypothetical protein [Sulfitobacter indolifex]
MQHLVHMLAMIKSQSLAVHDLRAMLSYPPPAEEGHRSALRQIALHLPCCGISDLAGCEPLDIDALE